MVKQDERLLTQEEMLAINNAQPSGAKYGDVFRAIAKAQLAKAGPIIRAEGFRDGVKATMDWAVKRHYVMDYDLEKFIESLKAGKKTGGVDDYRRNY